AHVQEPAQWRRPLASKLCELLFRAYHEGPGRLHGPLRAKFTARNEQRQNRTADLSCRHARRQNSSRSLRAPTQAGDRISAKRTAVCAGFAKESDRRSHPLLRKRRTL